MWSLFVVFAALESGLPSGVEQVVEPAYSPALLSQSSMKAFHASVLRGLAGLDMYQPHFPFNCPARTCRLVSSDPLSQRIDRGRPRCATISSNARVTRRLAKLVPTSSFRHSRVYASTTLSTRIDRPAAIASLKKSSSHAWLAPCARAFGFVLLLRSSSFWRAGHSSHAFSDP